MTIQFQNAARVFGSSATVSIARGPGYVDTRLLRTGLVRLRFHLTAEQYETLDAALARAYKLSHTLAEHKALSDICLSYVSEQPTAPAGSLAVSLFPGPGQSKRRRLFKLFPDEYELIRFALDEARKHFSEPDDTRALALVCSSFIKGSNDHEHE